MYRIAGPKVLRLDVVGDFLEMNCSDTSDLRGFAHVVIGDATSVVIQFWFSCEPVGDGLFFEASSGDRLTSIGTGKVSAAVINCKGFARVRMTVTTVTATANSVAIVMMSSYTEVVTFGMTGRE